MLIAHQHNFINKHGEIADKMDIVFKYSKWILYKLLYVVYYLEEIFIPLTLPTS